MYIEFVRGLVVRHNVLQKTFYVVIPYISPLMHKENFREKLKEATGKKKSKRIENIEQVIKRAQIKLNPRKEHVLKQLNRMGVDARQLTTAELVALFHRIYNPTEYVPLKIKREIQENQALS